MRPDDTTTSCPGCGVRLQVVDGPSHPYMIGSAACWARYSELLAAQYSDPDRMRFHQLVVDAYAVQHPGGDDRRAVQSVGIHLMTLCLFVEFGVDPAEGARLHRLMVERPVFHRLTAPTTPADRSMLDIPLDGPAAIAEAAAYAWATDVWTAWSAHHDTVRGWLTKAALIPAGST